MRKILLTPFICVSVLFAAGPISIADKKESLTNKALQSGQEVNESLSLVNETLEEKRYELGQLYQEASQLMEQGASEATFKPLVDDIKMLRHDIQNIQEMWRKEATTLTESEEYGLWQQPDTNLFQLVTDYGAGDYIYLIPSEIGSIKMSLFSALPIPRESWGECLELILSQYGVGIRSLNAYVRELYLLKKDAGSIRGITDNLQQLNVMPETARVCYILDPGSSDSRSCVKLLQRFANTNTLTIESIAGKVFITGSVQSIQELLKLYDFASTNQGGHETKVVSLNKLEAKQMETILKNAFSNEGSSLTLYPLENLSSSLFLSGTRDELKKAVRLIKEIEAQIENPKEKTVFWYVAKHSDAEELASVLARVYDLLKDGKASTKAVAAKATDSKSSSDPKKKEPLVVEPAAIKPSKPNTSSHKTADGQNNFIVDPKTGAIIMVVEQEALPKIKELLKKLDIPKKMVQIEVLLFEKKLTNQNNVGLNLLRLGSDALNKTASGLKWSVGGSGAGILDFFTSHKKGSGIPAYDLAYQFLMSQQDIQINASPSVTTMNQTPAKIAIVDEISIDAGANDKKERIYNRAQYGIVMEITPTINLEEEEDERYILLDTDITFDTTQKSADDRPDVTRRHIKNHVRIADGQTVILGGLRRKSCDDAKESIPFLGEIPGIGKLFSSTKMNDNSTEMFVFITPKIINDPTQEKKAFQQEELLKRPGDVPELLHSLLEGKANQKRHLFEGSMQALFGRQDSVVSTNPRRVEEFDGR